MTRTGDIKKPNRKTGRKTTAKQLERTHRSPGNGLESLETGPLLGQYSRSVEVTRNLLSSRFCPLNLVAFLWFAILSLYALKALQLGLGLAGCSATYCSPGDFFGGVIAGVAFTMAVSIADLIGLGELRGGTWVFVGGGLAWIFVERLEAKFAVKKFQRKTFDHD